MPAFLRKLTRRARLEREMQEELAFHIQARAEDLVRGGFSATDAQRQARIEFGGVDRYKEELRDTRHFGWLEDFARDLAYAWRNLRRSPVFAISAAGAIALGIGVNTSIFSLVYGVLYRPLSVRDPGSIRNVYMETRGEGPRTGHGSRFYFSFDEFTYLRAHSRTADLGAISEAGLTAPFAPAGLHAQLVSDNLLTLIAPPPALGRYFRRDEATTAGSGAVAVLSYDAWQKYFNGEDVAGRSITLNRTPFTIAGVAGRGFYGPLILKADLWIPITMQAITRAGEPLILDPNAGWLQVIGRLKPGAGDAAIRAELEVLAQQTLSAHAPAKRASIIVSPGALFNLPEVMKISIPALGILFLVVSLVLLVACANVANMLVARGFARTREIAIRLSIGAGKGRLVRQLLTEHVLLGLIGGMGGLVLAQAAVRALLSALQATGNHQIEGSPDWRIAAWTFLIALAAGVVFGLPAALGMTRGGLAQPLRGGAFEAGGKHRRFRLQSALIAIQVATSAMLLINAGLLLRAAGKAVRLDPGQATSGVLIARPNLRNLQYTPARAERYFVELRARALQLPGVTSASWTGFEPMQDSCGSAVQPIQTDGSAGSLVGVECNAIGADYLRVMRIRLLQGRSFEPADALPAASVAIVDEAFARRYLPGNPLGRRIRYADKTEGEREIVGVVANTTPLLFLKGDQPQTYTPLQGIRYLEGRLLVAYDGPRGPLVRALQAAGTQLDKESTLAVKPIEENVATALSVVRLAAAGVGVLGALALLLACTGVYGVVAFTVGRRRREIGVRIALGAQATGVMRLLVWQSLRPVIIGGAMGTALAAAVSQLIRSALYGVSPLDPLGFAAALALLAAVAAAASFLPARDALRVDPAVTLRHD